MCPTYLATGEEKHSTRGRAHLLHEMIRGEVIARRLAQRRGRGGAVALPRVQGLQVATARSESTSPPRKPSSGPIISRAGCGRARLIRWASSIGGRSSAACAPANLLTPVAMVSALPGARRHRPERDAAALRAADIPALVRRSRRPPRPAANGSCSGRIRSTIISARRRRSPRLGCSSGRIQRLSFRLTVVLRTSALRLGFLDRAKRRFERNFRLSLQRDRGRNPDHRP